MPNKNLIEILNTLISNWENEVVEFKEANDNFKTSKIGEYYSALSNEANLREQECAWLIFGVKNSTRSIVGSDFRNDPERLQSTKMQITQDTEPGVTFRNIHEVMKDGNRIVMFEIPPAPRGIPIAWKGHYYARSGESLTSLGLAKQDEIRNQNSDIDWSAKIVEDATLDDLDEQAIAKARESFMKKHMNSFTQDEMESWSLQTFLDRARLTRRGKITKAALLLLGKFESSLLLSPHPVQLTWKLMDKEQAYEHFGPPFLLNTTVLYNKIRNFQIRLLPDDSLLPVEVSKYDQNIILEAIHNCIAHQDYNKNGRVIVTEYQDRLVFENLGSFYDGIPEDYIYGEKTPGKYRNTCLAQAMTMLNMIDSMGYGIYKMNRGQAKRYFPLPDYEVDDPSKVRMTIYGKVVDLAYSRLLLQRTNLDFADIFALDRIQKKLPVSKEVIAHLRKNKYIEGRKPNIHISSEIAKISDTKVDYLKNRGLDDKYYEKLITDYLSKFHFASRDDIDSLLLEKLSDILDEKQKKTKIANLLARMRKRTIIENIGSRNYPKWVLTEKN